MRPGDVDLQATGQRLHVLRWQQGLSAKDLEDRSGVPEATILRYERAKVKPEASKLAALALALGASMDYLLGLPATEPDRGAVTPGLLDRIMWLRTPVLDQPLPAA